MNTSLAKSLRSAREAAGLTQGQAARLMALHRPTISEIEAGRRKVSAEELEEFADIYGVGVSWLLGEERGDAAKQQKIRAAARGLASLKAADLNHAIEIIKSLQSRKPRPDA